MGIIMSNLGRFPGSSLLQILTSRAMWEEIPGGSDNRKPSMAIFSIDFIFKIQNYTIKQISYYCWWYVLFLFLHIDNAWNIYLTQARNIFFFKYQWFQCSLLLWLPSTYFHSSLHGRQLCVRHLSGFKFPQQYSKAPHVCCLQVDVLWSSLKGWNHATQYSCTCIIKVVK